MVLGRVGIRIEHVQNTARLCRLRVVVGRFGLAVTWTTSRHFVGATSRYFFRRIKLLRSLEAGSTAYRAAEMVDIWVVGVLHRLFVSAHGKDGVKLVGSFESCTSANRTTMLVGRVRAMVLVFVCWVP